MTTSDVVGRLGGRDPVQPLEFLPPGLPDPAVLARMATQMFAEDFPSAAALPAVDGLNLAPKAVPAGIAPPIDGLGTAVASVAPPSVPGIAPLPSVPAVPALPSLPVGVPAPPLGFLGEVRPLFGQLPAMPIHAVDPGLLAAAPGRHGGGVPAIPMSVPPVPSSSAVVDGTTDSQRALHRAVPALAGSPQPSGLSGAAVPGLDFLELARPLFGGESPALAVDHLQPALAASGVAAPFDVNAVRRDFPILGERVNGRPLVWLDNAATTQKPRAVIERLRHYYEHENSNIHRAAHELAARSTDAYEAAREKTRRFLNASSTEEIIFVRGATEAINLVAQTWGKRNIQKGDEILVSLLEHHANIVPWQMLCAEKGAHLRVVPVDADGQILLEEYERLLGPRTKLVAMTHVSNALGTIVPVEAVTAAAHRHGARVLIDGAQAVSHLGVDVQVIGCDFYVFSGHKVFAPTGIGVVYGRSEVLRDMPPYQGGGNMIADVTYERTVFQPPPFRFEAGTGNIADAVGLGAAIDYVTQLGMHHIARYEHELLVYGTEVLCQIPGLHLMGTAPDKASVLSFVLDGFTNAEVGHHLNREGIAVRNGHHCAQPIVRHFGHEGTVRPSLAFYNTREEIDTLAAALWNLKAGRGAGPA